MIYMYTCRCNSNSPKKKSIIPIRLSGFLNILSIYKYSYYRNTTFYMIFEKKCFIMQILTLIFFMKHKKHHITVICKIILYRTTQNTLYNMCTYHEVDSVLRRIGNISAK